MLDIGFLLFKGHSDGRNAGKSAHAAGQLIFLAERDAKANRVVQADAGDDEEHPPKQSRRFLGIHPAADSGDQDPAQEARRHHDRKVECRKIRDIRHRVTATNST